MPLLAWGANFNYSIWHVTIHGINDTQLVQRITQEYGVFRETQVVRLCLKYFRQRNYADLFQILQGHTGICLESPELAQLHQVIVAEGGFEEAEAIMCEAAKQNVFQVIPGPT